MEVVEDGIKIVREYAKNSVRLVRRCTKPNQKEFTESAFAVALGVFVMGFTAYLVKLVHIPINKLIVG